MSKLLSTLACVLLFFLQIAVAQTMDVSGTVKGPKGNPLHGASIIEKGTKNGTVADENGRFKLTVKSGAKLIISALGFNPQEVVAGMDLLIGLTEDSRALSEVIVTGTGVATSKRNTAFAVEAIRADKLPAAPTADVGNALVGKIAGAQISSVNGNPGAPVQILLRGINSINGGTMPIILLDGVQIAATGLELLDLSNVERIEVVQGPAASTIYGAQGANGVIQLFSKKGQQGKLSINVSSSIAINELLNIGKVNKAKKHAWKTDAAGNIVGASSGVAMEFDEATGSYQDNLVGNLISAGSAYNKFYDKNLLWYDHYKMFFKKAPTYNNSINLSGAREKMDFSFNMADTRQQSVFKDNGDYSRTNLGVNLGVELAKGLRFRSTTQLVLSRSTLLDDDGRDMFYAVNNARPFANFEQKDASGRYSPYFGDAVGVNHYNFNYVVENADYKENSVDLLQSFNLNYRFPRFLELDVKYGYNRSDFNRRYQIYDQTASEGAEFWQYWAEGYSPRTSFASPTTGSESGEINNRRIYDEFQNLLSTATLRFKFDDDFKLNIPLTATTQAAWDYRRRYITDFWSWASDAPDFSPYNASNMANFKIATDTKSLFATYGYFINQRFDWNGIAGVSAGFRSDYSSAFGQGSKPFTFPRGDAYVRLSGFKFWENLGAQNVVNEFKLRAAYGEAGIQPGAYDRFPILNAVTIGSQSALGTPVTNANPNLEIEVSKELEIGTDLGFKLSRSTWFPTANLSFTYWKRTSENVIDRVDVAPSTGIGRLLTNAITLGSNGIQASLNLAVANNKNFTWNFTTNLSRQKSYIESVEGGAELIKTSAAGSASYVIRAGEQIGQLYGFLLLHSVDQKDPSGNFFIPEANHKDFTVASNGWVVNKATRQPYASAGRYSLGDPNPDFNLSFINEFTFKNWLIFNFQWDWLQGNNLYNQTKGWMYRDGIHKDYDNPITIDGQTDAWSAFYRGVYAVRSFNGTKNYFMEDASFVRLRNVAVGFDIAKLVPAKFLNRAQLVFSGRNLLTFTDYTGMDPEISSGSLNSAWDRGVDHNTIPNIKSYQVTLNLGF